VVTVAMFGLTGCQAHPHRQLQRPLRGYCGIHRLCGELNAAHTPSPVCLNNQPPCALIASRDTASCAVSAARIASASASHRRVRTLPTPKEQPLSQHRLGLVHLPSQPQRRDLAHRQIVVGQFRQPVDRALGFGQVAPGLARHLAPICD
jgi:hypothetical protein